MINCNAVVDRASLSFIVPIYNHLCATKKLLDTLLDSLPAGVTYEVFLVDDASTDGTRAWLSDLSLPHINVILNEHNIGYACSINRGAALALGEYLFLLNNDLVLSPGWLEAMFAVLHKTDRCNALVGNVQYRVDDGLIDHAGVELSCLGAFNHKQPVYLPLVDSARVLAVTGACMLIRREVFNQLGGYDERFVNGCEDIDLCYRARSLGLDVLVSYTSQIKHHVSLSRGAVSLQNERNSQMLFAKLRNEIKHDLAAIWFPLLQSRSGWDALALPGILSDTFLASPFIASLTIAETILCRLEAYWARTLGDAPLTPVNQTRVSMNGIEQLPSVPYFMVTNPVVIDVFGLNSARNVYVCGFKADADEQREFLVTFEVNGIQTVVQRLATEQNINVGVINPIWLSSASNRIKVSFAFVGEDGVAFGNACGAVRLTHIVVDDQEFRNLV